MTTTGGDRDPSVNAELALRASRGDSAALDALIERHLPALRAFVRLRSGPVVRAKESCSDLVQSVCREILEDAGAFEYQGEAAFRNWLFTKALRKILDRNKFYRRDKRDIGREAAQAARSAGPGAGVARCYATICSPNREAMVHEEVEALERAFDRLPDNYREVITLARVVGLSHAEIAERLGVTEAYSRSLLSRALARLARLLRTGDAG